MILDQEAILHGITYVGYGWVACWAIAINGTAILNADSHAMYSLAIILAPDEYWLGKKVNLATYDITSGGLRLDG